MAGMREFVVQARAHARRRLRLAAAARAPRAAPPGRRSGFERVAPGRGSETAELAAYHYVEALRYGDEDTALATRAFELLLEAGESAIARAAVPSAIGLFERALSIAADARGRCLALVALARSDLATLAFGRANARLLEAADLAREINDPMLVSDVLSWLTRISWLSGQWDEAMRYAAEGVDALEGLPESPALATALARRSQLEMLRGDLLAEAHAEEAIAVATRVGDDFAATNARINLITAKAARGVQPDRDHAFAVFAGAIEAGYLDEAYRLAVNYLWSASPHKPIPELRDALAGSDRPAGGSARRRVRLLPPVSDPLPREVPLDPERRVGSSRRRSRDARRAAVDGSNRLLWSEIACGMALRRGDIATVDELLPDWIEKAMASQEPQRTIPMAAVALARAGLAGDAAAVRSLTEMVLEAVDNRAQWAPLASAAIPRAMFAVGEIDLLEQTEKALVVKATTARYTHAVALACTGLRALAEGRPSDVFVPLREAVDLERERGAPYNAACAELECARPRRLGDEEAAKAARGGRTQSSSRSVASIPYERELLPPRPGYSRMIPQVIEIHGTTTLVGLLGWPTSHSLSPPMQNAGFAALGARLGLRAAADAARAARRRRARACGRWASPART